MREKTQEQNVHFTAEVFENYWHHPHLGEVIGTDEAEQIGANFRPAEIIQTDEEFLNEHRKQLSSQDIRQTLDNLYKYTSFQKGHGKWEYVPVINDFSIIKDGVLSKYTDVLKKSEAKTGKTEAATYGYADFDGQECIMFAMNFDFIGGSVGKVVGDKLMAAATLAKRKNLSLITVYSTGGMRQQENFEALAQMARGVEAIEDFKENCNQPHIAVLLGQVWGGTSASTVPLADCRVGVKGSNFGFAGPNVIAGFQGKQPPAGSQSVEANYLNRYVDVMVNKAELPAYISKLIKVSTVDKAEVKRCSKLSPEELQQEWDKKHPLHSPRNIVIKQEGIAPALFESQIKETDHGAEVYEFPSYQKANTINPSEEDLFENYEKITKDPARIDGEYILENMFDEVVPLYNHYIRGNTIVYPPLISAIGKMDGQPYLFVANQPSYTVKKYTRPGKDDEIRIVKHLSTPRPEDYEHFTDLMGMAKRRNLPVITFVDTLGAAPTIESERRGQSNQIARAIQAIRNHDKPVISVVTGGLGSGGGMAITNISPEFLALDDAQIWVAEPKSASSILHKIAQPTVEMVKHMLKEMKCTPFDIKKLGYPLRIIKSEEDLRNTIRNIRFAVLQSYQRQNGYGETKLHKLRTRIYRSMGKKAIKISQDQTVSKGGYISD